MEILNISPVDGRYFNSTKELKEYFSEKALIKYRVFTEIHYLIHLAKNKIGLKPFSKKERDLLISICNISDEDALLVKQIETKGYKDIPATNHDVKAIEYFIKEKLKTTTLRNKLEMVHFALTSEDINNISYALIIKESFNNIIFKYLIEIYHNLYDLALKYKDISMLARTHGQPASPTTFGKEVLVFVNRLKEEIRLLKEIKIMVKLNGATGNYNAHYVAFENIDWINFSLNFLRAIDGKREKLNNPYVSSVPLSLSCNLVTTQIEPHDSFVRLFDSIKRINNILLDFSMDIWRYISDNWLKQKVIKGEVGSSTMPHKVNPIDFENAEGNLGLANALFQFFSSKLPVSRLQRDLSDSTVLRNIGVAFAHSLIGYKSILKGLQKIEVNREKIKNDLESNPEVVAEAYQTILRVAGVEKPYEILKEITRGEKISLNDFHNLIKRLNLNEKIKQKLFAVTPHNYIGLAQKIVEKFNPKIY